MFRTRNDIINRITNFNKHPTAHHVSNIEEDGYSYKQGFAMAHLDFNQYKIVGTDGKTTHVNVDIRFVDDMRGITILVECKNRASKWKKAQIEQQLQAYVEYEKVLTGNKIIAILADLESSHVQVWAGENLKIDDAYKLTNQTDILPFDDYADIYIGANNNRQAVVKATYKLNEKLHVYGIPDKFRSQFVGTCVLCLKNNLSFEHQSTKSIIGGMEEIIKSLLAQDDNRTEKFDAIVAPLHDQKIEEMDANQFADILRYIQLNIIPNINDKTTMGQDLLNLFYTTFNKYVGKDDKNQAFSPDHIVHFIGKAMSINRNSIVLDPTCGSGAFITRALTEALDDCTTPEEREIVRNTQVYGIEKYKNAYGLSVTNMLLHGATKVNIVNGDCFELGDWIESKGFNVVLMNPPYNATIRDCNPEYRSIWMGKKEDPTKGLHFVHYVASKVKRGKLAVLLPMQCAIATSGEILEFKRKMLAENTLDAVFTFPPDMFHPGASANACCMIFDLGIRHDKANKATFFGYFKDDGYEKRKNMGRLEKRPGLWAEIESRWLDLYHNRIAVPSMSVLKKVTAEEEWLAEAYMETDYSTLTNTDFERTIREFVAYKITNPSK